MESTIIQWKVKFKININRLSIWQPFFFVMARKLKKGENYLELIPVRNPNLEFIENKKGLIVLTVPNIGLFNRIAQKVYGRPKSSKIHMDAYSSYVWKGINGKRNVYELGKYLKRKYGDEAEPLYERLTQFMNILRDNNYIGFLDEDGVQIK